MKAIPTLLLLATTLASAEAAPEYNFQKMIQPVPLHSKLEHKDWSTWGSAVLKGDDGKYHMFYCRWPKSIPWATSWVVDAEICYAVADAPDGPFKHVRTILRGRKHEDKPQSWDGASVYNPHLKQFGNKFYLYYTAGHDPYSKKMIGSRDHVVANQCIGVLVANSLQDLATGKFKRFDQPILKPVKRFGRFVKKGEQYGDINDPIPANTIVVNPSIDQRADGKYILMYKSWKPKGGMTHAVAIGDSPTGPFTFHPGEAFKGYAEDPYIWFDQRGQKFFCLVKDFNGSITKKGASMALFESEDGIQWKHAKHLLASDLRITWKEGSTRKVHHLERPQLLFDEAGKPIMLYAACALQSPVRNSGKSFNIHIPLADED
ncbi:sucrase [Verrucomicrobiaceae bacterium N1E253]|uniref:Sucrase n=1 Tax=Oceaniferula marina TaxID=2748318 RepID=A0A851GGS4_9BACT|nr:glycoside hydrolase family protein [Oceaniferula marina]NWK55041.1 sucrase [Oceaniferula marina]